MSRCLHCGDDHGCNEYCAPLNPIAEYRKALKEIERLWSRLAQAESEVELMRPVCEAACKIWEYRFGHSRHRDARDALIGAVDAFMTAKETTP